MTPEAAIRFGHGRSGGQASAMHNFGKGLARSASAKEMPKCFSTSAGPEARCMKICREKWWFAGGEKTLLSSARFVKRRSNLRPSERQMRP